MRVLDRDVRRVAVVDDSPPVREAYGLAIEELDAEPIQVVGPFRDVQDFVASLDHESGVICDHHLTVSSYSTFNGAELVSAIYASQRSPVILCTRWEDASVDEMRRFRAGIPVLLRPDELSPETIRAGFTVCLSEYVGDRASSRRPWRALVRIEDVDERNTAYIVVTGWDPNQIVRVPRDCFEELDWSIVVPGARLHVSVNLGAERHEDLYFTGWEPG